MLEAQGKGLILVPSPQKAAGEWKVSDTGEELFHVNTCCPLSSQCLACGS